VIGFAIEFNLSNRIVTYFMTLQLLVIQIEINICLYSTQTVSSKVAKSKAFYQYRNHSLIHLFGHDTTCIRSKIK